MDYNQFTQQIIAEHYYMIDENEAHDILFRRLLADTETIPKPKKQKVSKQINILEGVF